MLRIMWNSSLNGGIVSPVNTPSEVPVILWQLWFWIPLGMLIRSPCSRIIWQMLSANIINFISIFAPLLSLRFCFLLLCSWFPVLDFHYSGKIPRGKTTQREERLMVSEASATISWLLLLWACGRTVQPDRLGHVAEWSCVNEEKGRKGLYSQHSTTCPQDLISTHQALLLKVLPSSTVP